MANVYSPPPICSLGAPSSQTFDNPEFGRLDIFTIDREQWMIARQVATMLGYSIPHKAIADHVEPDDKRLLSYDEIQRFQIGSFASPRGLMLINEFGFNDLVLASRLPAAKRIKRWVTHEVMPAIRRTGSYTLPTAEPTVLVEAPPTVPVAVRSLNAAVDDLGSLSQKLTDIFGTGRGIALSKAMNLVEQAYGINLGQLRELLPPADGEVGLLNPTQIGKCIGMTAQAANRYLVALGLQVKVGEQYQLSERGKTFGEMIPFTKHGHSGYRPLWKSSVIDFIKKWERCEEIDVWGSESGSEGDNGDA